jgi:hypothetical protein
MVTPLAALRSRGFTLAALLAGAMVLAIPVVASAAPSTPLLSTHVVRAESLQNPGYYSYHRKRHHRHRHHRYSRYVRSGWRYD